MASWEDSNFETDSYQEELDIQKACEGKTKFLHDCISSSNLPKGLHLEEYSEFSCQVQVSGFDPNNGYDTLTIGCYPHMNEWDTAEKKYYGHVNTLLFQLSLGEKPVYIKSLGYDSPGLEVFFTGERDRILEQIEKLAS